MSASGSLSSNVTVMIKAGDKNLTKLYNDENPMGRGSMANQYIADIVVGVDPSDSTKLTYQIIDRLFSCL